jgi:hypothetical protein
MFKTFAASCVLAATASAMDIKSVPEWIGGFVTGMTGENHLDEIANCYKGTESLAKEAVDAFTQIRHGHVIKGAREA